MDSIFQIGFKCSDDFKFQKINNFFKKIIELSFYEEENEWKNNLLLIEFSEIVSDNFIDLLIYKNHYSLTEKIHVFLGKHDCKQIC